eukprot:scaffold5868_cov120-Isochrysis_galbana.AAC.16
MGAGAAGNGVARLDPQPSVRVPDRAAPTCPCKQVSDQPAARRSNCPAEVRNEANHVWARRRIAQRDTLQKCDAHNRNGASALGAWDRSRRCGTSGTT